MTCTFCGSRNSSGETRCRRCGRRPDDTLTGEFTLTKGALAAKPQLMPRTPVSTETQESFDSRKAIQATLFPSKVVPIAPYAPRPAKPRQPSDRPRISRKPPVSDAQGELDFLPASLPKARTLGTSVEAVIYCDAPVATSLHRAVAAALDWAMVLIAYGLFLAGYYYMGGAFTLERPGILMFGAMLPLIALAYGLVWTIARTETAGMRWMQLKLVTFDGYPPENRHRVLRFLGSCLSICTVVGLLWSLADEETLTWQDYISHTFPTLRDADEHVFRRV